MSLLDASETSYSFIQHTQELIHRSLLVDCLRKPRKTQDDCERIYETIREYEFFKNLFASYVSEHNTEALLDFCSGMRHESMKMGNFVFNQGDESNQKFYVILTGQVGVITKQNFIPQPRLSILNGINFSSIQTTKTESNLDDAKEVESKETPKHRSALRFGENFGAAVARTMAVKKAALKVLKRIKGKSNLPSLISLEEEDNNDKVFKEIAEQHGMLVRVLNPGEDFGDAVFKKPGQKRTASILCKTDCEFLIISASAYVSFISGIRERRRKFLLGAFSFLSSIYSSQSQGFSEGDRITEQDQKCPNSKIYLIEFGTCKIQKKFIVEAKNPFNRTQVLNTQTHWLTLCVVGPGTLLGEETLMWKANEEQYGYRAIVHDVTSRKMSALSINKQVFLKLHPDLEREVIKFYLTKQAQRDETYARLSNEILGQGQSKERENRTFAQQRIANPTLQLDAYSPTNHSDLTATPQSTYSINKTPTGASIHQMKTKWITEEMSLSESPETQILPRDGAKASNEVIKLEENDSPFQRKSLSRVSPSPVRDDYFKLEKLHSDSHSSRNAEENHFIFTQNQSEKLLKKFHGSEETPVKRETLSKTGTAGNYENEHQRFIESPKGKMILSEDSNDLNIVNPISRELINLRKPRANHLHATQQITSPKSGIIRMKPETSKPDNIFIENERNSVKEQLRSLYLEKLKLAESSDPSDLENFRFEFYGKKNQKSKRKHDIQSKFESDRLVQPKVVREVKHAEEHPEAESPSLSPKRKITAIKEFLQSQKLINSGSASPIFKFGPQNFERVRKGPNYRQANLKNRFLDTSGGNLINLSLSNSRKYQAETHQAVTPSNRSLTKGVSTTLIIQNTPELTHLSGLKEETTAKRTLRETNAFAENQASTSRQTNSNQLMKILMQKSHNHHKLHQKSPFRLLHSTNTKDMSKNDSNYSLRIDSKS